MPKVKRFNKEEVLEKAMTLFWKKGYHQTSIQDMVAYLEISRSSLYDTFGGKRKLFYRAFDRYRISHYEGLQHFLHEQQQIKITLRGIFERVIMMNDADVECKGCLIANSTTELLPDDPFLQNIITEHKQNMEGLFCEFLQKGINSGEIPKGKDIKTISRLLYTLLTGIRVVGKTKPQVKESMASVDTILSLLD